VNGWGSRDLASGGNAGQSRINLPQLLTIAGSWRFCQPAIVKILTKKAPELTGVYAQSPWDVFSQDSSIISKIALMSASDTGDFLRLAGELAENCGRVGC
jgi:hypothetical protein